MICLPYKLVLTSLSPCAPPQVDGDFDAWMEVLCLVYHGGALRTELRAAIVLLRPCLPPLHACVSHGLVPL